MDTKTSGGGCEGEPKGKGLKGGERVQGRTGGLEASVRQKWRARLTHIPEPLLMSGGCAVVARTVGEGDPQGPPR